jgi:hypothetical protein
VLEFGECWRTWRPNRARQMKKARWRAGLIKAFCLDARNSNRERLPMEVPSSFSSLEIEFRKFGFQPCVFLETYCKRHGAFRSAITGTAESDDRYPCPRCGALVACSPPLANGFTKRELPFSEFVDGRLLHNDKISEKEDWERERARLRRRQRSESDIQATHSGPHSRGTLRGE